MPKLSDPASAPPLRALVIGDSGTGKTGGLASLALSGYSLWIADFDNGIEILRNTIKKVNPAALERVDFEICRDPYKVSGFNTIPSDAKAWAKGIKYIEKAINSGLGPEDIVVIDSLSFAAATAMNYILKMNNRLASGPVWSDWGEAQRMVENLVGMLTEENVRCHILCTAHVAISGGKRIEKVGKGPDAQSVVIDDGPVRKLPAMIGKAFNPKVPRYFNHMLLAHRVGSGPAAKRVFHTTTFDDIELKNTNPGVIKAEYPIATGLADYFRDARV